MFKKSKELQYIKVDNECIHLADGSVIIKKDIKKATREIQKKVINDIMNHNNNGKFNNLTIEQVRSISFLAAYQALKHIENENTNVNKK